MTAGTDRLFVDVASKRPNKKVKEKSKTKHALTIRAEDTSERRSKTVEEQGLKLDVVPPYDVLSHWVL